MLNPSQKICSMCRRKLYVMQNRTSSVLDLSDMVPQSSSENSNLADTSGVSHVDQDQLTANAEDRTDVELPDEGHGEDGIGSEVAEESVDLMAQSENSPCVTDLNEAALYEVTDAISEDESTDCSASSKVEDEFIQMNVGLASFGVSPLSKRQMQRKGSSYGQKKLRKVVEVLSEKLGVSHDPDGDADSEIIAQLKEKFKTTTNRSEKIQILTVLPNSWSLCKIMQEFGVSNYMARCAKKLVAEKGILSTPNLKHGRCLPAATENLVKAFYHSDNISRVMPGRKDYVSVMTAEGKREHCQKRLLLCNLKELYEQFKTLNPGIKIGFSTFAMLRPRECVLAGSSGTHSVCVCSLHQNAKLMFYGSKIATLSEGAISHYRHCLAAIMCNPPRIQCYLGKCKQCPGTEPLHLKLQGIMDSNMVDTVEYKQWTSTDRSTMETVIQPVDEFLPCFMKTLKTLKRHDLIAKQQSNFVTDAKERLGPNEFLVITDFSENYSCVCQDATQSFHWNKLQATIHPFLAYYRDEQGNLQHKCYIMISECTKHDTIAVHLFQKNLIQFLTDTFGKKPSKIIYVSDGCAAQYKNRKNFINLCHHMEDFGVPAEWHFFATSHGKSAADGCAGTLKRLATKASLQRAMENQILNSKQLYEFAIKEIEGMSFGYVTNKDHEEEAKLLEARLLLSKRIPGTQKLHCIKPISNCFVLVKEYSNSSDETKKRVNKRS